MGQIGLRWLTDGQQHLGLILFLDYLHFLFIQCHHQHILLLGGQIEPNRYSLNRLIVKTLGKTIKSIKTGLRSAAIFEKLCSKCILATVARLVE